LPSLSGLSRKELDNSESYIVEEFASHTEYNQVSAAAGAAAAEKLTCTKPKRQLAETLPLEKVAA